MINKISLTMEQWGKLNNKLNDFQYDTQKVADTISNIQGINFGNVRVEVVFNIEIFPPTYVLRVRYMYVPELKKISVDLDCIGELESLTSTPTHLTHHAVSAVRRLLEKSLGGKEIQGG